LIGFNPNPFAFVIASAVELAAIVCCTRFPFESTASTANVAIRHLLVDAPGANVVSANRRRRP
jgi:hypothetical protein